MKVRLTVDVSEADRYIIALYFREQGRTPKRKGRATRRQTAAFTAAALHLAIKDHRDALRGRPSKVVDRLLTGRIRAVHAVLEPPKERNARLF